ncbi:hypothetical protein Tco_0397362 [Tanacetum coccineum]
MDLDSTQNNALQNCHCLSKGDYDTWILIIESYIQLQDYALREIIEEANSFKPVVRTTTNEDGTSTTKITGAVTTEQKIQKKNYLKARSILMMTLPSEHLLTFNKQKDAKSLFEAIEARFGGFRKFIQVWSGGNKSDLAQIAWMSLYNNFKIVEPEVKGSVTSSSNSGSQNLAFVSASSSTNDHDATVYAFLATQPNGSQVVHEDLEQIHEDDLDEMDLNWQLALLKEEAPTNFALMAFSDCEVQNNKTYSKACLKNFKDLKSRYDKLRIEFNKYESDLDNYKRGLASVEEQLVFYKKNKGLFAPPTFDFEKFKQPEFEGNGVKISKSIGENVSKKVKKTLDAPIIKDWNNNITNWNEKKTQKLGVGFQFTKKACFVCGSFNHLIKDCDFHDKKMVQKPVMNNVQKGTGQREVRPVWNNALRTNHQNFSNSRRNFAPTAVLTKSGIVPISTARQRSSRAAAPLSAARPINTAAPKLFVNVAKTKPNVFQKAHSLSRGPFNQQTALNKKSLNNKVNIAKVNSVNTAKGKRVTSDIGEQGINAVKSSACWGDPQVSLKDTWIFDSGCSRHMTRNKSYLTDYQDYNGGFVAFAGSSKGGRITSKCKIKTGKLDFKDL